MRHDHLLIRCRRSNDQVRAGLRGCPGESRTHTGRDPGGGVQSDVAVTGDRWAMMNIFSAAGRGDVGVSPSLRALTCSFFHVVSCCARTPPDLGRPVDGLAVILV
jgi:hypothetical protein